MLKQAQNYVFFCNLEDEATLHIFASCTKTTILWANIKTTQSAMFGFSDADLNIFLVLNHIFLLFKRFVYISRDSIILLSSRLFRHLQYTL